jgi:hypothetical protein
MLGVGSAAGPPFGYPPRLRSGLRQNRAGFLEKREKGRTPGYFVSTLKDNPRYKFLAKVARLQSAFIVGLFFGPMALSMTGLIAHNCLCRRFLVRARQKTCITDAPQHPART